MAVQRYVSVRFHGSSFKYTYRNHLRGLKLGDMVVVENQEGKFKIVTVTSIKPCAEERAKAWRWVVDKIDMTKYEALKALATEEPVSRP